MPRQTKVEPIYAFENNQVSSHMESVPMKMTTKTSGNVKCFWVTAIVLGVIMTLLLGLIAFALVTRPATENEQLKTPKLITSCLDLKAEGKKESGIYKIQPQSEFQPYEVYCDLETDEGGWTLVASVHEDDIARKCNANDRWATYMPSETDYNYRYDHYNYYYGYYPYEYGFQNQEHSSKADMAWDNKKVFGTVLDCTADDYKNTAYFSLNARDVMIWHVPSGTSTDSMRDQATLRYRTTNNFLQSTGGNLKSLFEEHYPLEIKDEYTHVHRFEELWLDDLLDALETNAAVMKAFIPDWYPYQYQSDHYDYHYYSDHKYFIYDDTLYNNHGNRVYFGERQYYWSLQYGEEYSKSPNCRDCAFGSRESSPFIMASVITNYDGGEMEIATRVESYRNQQDVVQLLENEITSGNFNLQYKAVHFSNSEQPTYCEMHFVITSEKDWASIKPTAFEQTYSNNGTSHWNNNEFMVSGKPINFVMGYVLLTRTQGNDISLAHTDGVASIILQAVSSLTHLFKGNFGNEGLVAPVIFDKGDEDDVIDMTPPVLRSTANPGHLQFRAYDFSGYPNALCPGIKMNGFRSKYVCIGGLSGSVGEHGTCGDFAGWAGTESKTLGYAADGLAHSEADVNSVILIFYR